MQGFESGVGSLDRWLLEHGLTAGASGSARTFVITDGEQGRVVGYHAITAASIAHVDSIERATKGMPRQLIPAALLARLAVDRSVQGRGLGAWLLRDAMLRTLAASEELGIRVMIVHAINDSARAFYLRHGLGASSTDPLNLQILIKDIRATGRSFPTRVVRHLPHDLETPAFGRRPRPGGRAAPAAQEVRHDPGDLSST